MKKIIFLTLLSVSLCIFGCDKNKTPDTGGGAGSDWEKVLHDTWGAVRLPVERPPMYETPLKARYYSSVVPSPQILSLVDEAIADQLNRSKKDNPDWGGVDWRKWTNSDEHREYDVLAVPAERRSETPAYLDCPLITSSGRTIAGIMTGWSIRNGVPIARGGAYIVVPILDREDREECRELFKKGVDHESEHRRLLEEPQLFFHYQGVNDVHPIFPE